MKLFDQLELAKKELEKAKKDLEKYEKPSPSSGNQANRNNPCLLYTSYKDLPIRYGETSTLFRNEASGEMHGLIRVRQFTLSEGHIICTPEQLEDEFMGVLDLIKYLSLIHI